MICYGCGEEITRDMTDFNGRILMIHVGKKDYYICNECENDFRVYWEDEDEIEGNVLAHEEY